MKSAIQSGIDPFAFGNVLKAMKNDLSAICSSLSFAQKCLELPVRVVGNAGVFNGPVVKPVFIIGAPRSGTTFVGDCISAIESIRYFHEPASTKCAAAHVYLYPERWASLGRYYRFQYRLLMASHQRNLPRGKLRFSEKTPRNCFTVSFLNRTFPDARFVHLIRDGRDSAYSNSRKHWLDEGLDGSGRKEHAGYLLGSSAQFWTESNRCQEYEASTRLKRCGWLWRRYTETALEQLAGVPAERQIQIRYEEMAQNPADIARSLGAFLEISTYEQNALSKEVCKVNKDSIGSATRELDQIGMQELVSECETLLCQLNYK